jgi:hypothetical protein
VPVTEATYAAVPPIPIHELPDVDRARVEVRLAARRLDRGATVKLVTLPGVQGLSHATRFIDGGRDAFIEWVQLAVQNRNEVAIKWWAVYAELPPYPRSIVSLDDVCAASGVKPSELMPVVVSTAMAIGMDVGNLVAAAMHPKVVAAHIRSAAHVGGEHAEIHLKDRMAFLQARNMAPLPKNTTINVNANASASAKAAAQARLEPSVPSFSDEMATLQDPRAGVQQQLAEGSVIDVEPDSHATFAFLQKPAQGA